MESRTPVNILTGVRMGHSRVWRFVPQVITATGILHSHQVHSTVTAFITPAYNSAPKGVMYRRVLHGRECILDEREENVKGASLHPRVLPSLG